MIRHSPFQLFKLSFFLLKLGSLLIKCHLLLLKLARDVPEQLLKCLCRLHFCR